MKKYYNENTKEWYTEGDSMTRKIDDGVFSGIQSEEQLEEWGFVEVIIPAPTPEELLEKAKMEKFSALESYDSSDAVNGFVVGGKEMWVPADKRAILRISIEAYKGIGAETITKVWEGQEYTFSTTDWYNMLNQVEVYASECFNQTQRHKDAIIALDSIEAVENYDFTDGYPEKPVFE